MFWFPSTRSCALSTVDIQNCSNRGRWGSAKTKHPFSLIRLFGKSLHGLDLVAPGPCSLTCVPKTTISGSQSLPANFRATSSPTLLQALLLRRPGFWSSWPSADIFSLTSLVSQGQQWPMALELFLDAGRSGDFETLGHWTTGSTSPHDTFVAAIYPDYDVPYIFDS